MVFVVVEVNLNVTKLTVHEEHNSQVISITYISNFQLIQSSHDNDCMNA